jgi:TRAP-type C4-dicarboxylate transport system permease small subunit
MSLLRAVNESLLKLAGWGTIFFMGVIDAVPSGLGRLLKGAGILFMLCFLATMTWYGGVQTLINFDQTSPAMGIRMGYPYACLPAGFFVMLMLTLEQALLFLGAKPPKEEAA